MIKSRKFSRRSLLGLGAGAAASLPFLRSSPSSAEATSLSPRLLIVVTPSGFIDPEHWTPAGSGSPRALTTLPPMMAPITPHLDDLLLLDRIDGKSEAGHLNASVMLTGVGLGTRYGESDYEQWGGGLSADHFIRTS